MDRKSPSQPKIKRKTPLTRGSTGSLVVGGIAIIAVAVAVIAFMRFPRTFNVDIIGDNATSTGMGGGNPSVQQSGSGILAAVGTYANPAMPLPGIDHASYDAKILALAHIPPAPPVIVTSTRTATGTFSSGTLKTAATNISAESTEEYPPFAMAPPRSQIMSLWPVPITKAPYPNAGALLPFNRIVAYYGNLYSKQMGVLGQYPEPQMLAMLASTTAMWQAADTSTHVIPALDYIAVTAQGSAGTDGKYRARMPADQIDEVLRMAEQINGIVVLDVQVGLSNAETEVPLLEPYLKLPQVELALDPEFAMHNGARPGTVIGTMDASDINWTANYLANLVDQYHLPPKILIVHRFTQDMVTHTADITPLPEVQLVMDMDGFGSEMKKLNTYYSVIEPEPVEFTGFKLFYKNDTDAGHLMTPQDVLRLSPQPSFIQYQ